MQTAASNTHIPADNDTHNTITSSSNVAHIATASNTHISEANDTHNTITSAHTAASNSARIPAGNDAGTHNTITSSTSAHTAAVRVGVFSSWYENRQQPQHTLRTGTLYETPSSTTQL